MKYGKYRFYFPKGLRILLNPKAVQNSWVDKNAKIGSGADFRWSSISRFSYTGRNSSIYHSTIGQFCSIANNCIIGMPNHPLDMVSTSPIMYSRSNPFKEEFCDLYHGESLTTTIGNDVWIGDNVLVKAGVTIGDGAIIGMGSVVTKDVAPYAIVGGAPAKLIRYRFDSDTIAQLLSAKWWNFDTKTIKILAGYSNDISTFLTKIKEFV